MSAQQRGIDRLLAAHPHHHLVAQVIACPRCWAILRDHIGRLDKRDLQAVRDDVRRVTLEGAASGQQPSRLTA